jgi:hypothetical protein
MYKMASVGALVVSPANVLTAIAFQSVITAGSPAATVAGAAVAAVPAARAPKRTAAVKVASQLVRCAFRRRIKKEESWRTTRISHPRAARSP